MSNGRTQPHPKFKEVHWVRLEDEVRRLATVNLTPGRSVYGEKIFSEGGMEYRVWDPYRSKLAAAIIKNLEVLPISTGSIVLYLGAASGTTVSHVSDIVGMHGKVFSVEFAQRAARDFLRNVASYRSNVIPIVADARLPERYRMLVDTVHCIYCDIAQPAQAKILADNAEFFLRGGGWGILLVKAHSIDVTKHPSEVYKAELKVLREHGFKERQIINLEPYDKAHSIIVSEYKPRRA